MDVKQLHALVNSATSEVLGKTDLVATDLSNIVDVGTEVLNQNAMDAYVKSLVNHIGKVVYTIRPYRGKAPSLLMDSWEYGSVLEKIAADIPEAKENKSWELTDGTSYDQDIFYKPNVSAKFYNSQVTFEIPISITERQVKQSFSNATQLNGFVSMLYDSVEKSMTIKTDALIMRTIGNMIDATFKQEPSGGTEKRAINLLKGFNAATGGAETVAKALYNPAFIRYASYQIGLYCDRLGSISTLFNIGGKPRFTDASNRRVILLSDFASAANTYLYSDMRNVERAALPAFETVPYWQGSGLDYSFNAISSFKVSKPTEQTHSGIIGVAFDKEACAVCNLSRRVTTNYNAKAEFFNSYYKFDAGYFNDTNENFIVFYIKENG